MSIFTHVTVGTNNLPKARSFYDNVFGRVGAQTHHWLGRQWLYLGGENAPSFFVLKTR